MSPAPPAISSADHASFVSLLFPDPLGTSATMSSCWQPTLHQVREPCWKSPEATGLSPGSQALPSITCSRKPPFLLRPQCCVCLLSRGPDQSPSPLPRAAQSSTAACPPRSQLPHCTTTRRPLSLPHEGGPTGDSPNEGRAGSQLRPGGPQSQLLARGPHLLLRALFMVTKAFYRPQPPSSQPPLDSGFLRSLRGWCADVNTVPTHSQVSLLVQQENSHRLQKGQCPETQAALTMSWRWWTACLGCSRRGCLPVHPSGTGHAGLCLHLMSLSWLSSTP